MKEIDTIQRQLAAQYDKFVALGRATEEEKRIRGQRLIDALETLDSIARALSENRVL